MSTSRHCWLEILDRRASLTAAWLATAAALPAAAQLPDFSSQAECLGCAAALAQQAFEGVWSTALTAPDEPHWALEDFFCIAGCTEAGRAAAASLLVDAQYAQRTVLELYPVAFAATIRSVEAHLLATHARDKSGPAGARVPGFACDPRGFAEQVVSPLPLKIERAPGRLILRYEERGVERTILLQEAAPASGAAATPLGVSLGHFEQGVLVVETTDVAAGQLSAWLGGALHSRELRGIERYSLGADGRSLELLLELHDVETFALPLVVTKRWVRRPDARIASYRCDVMSAGLEGVFAEYLDPRKIEERRRALRSAPIGP